MLYAISASLMIGLFTGYFFARTLNCKTKAKAISSAASLSFSTAPAPSANASASSPKLILLIRTDLNMTKGKIVAQCCHAALTAVESAAKGHKASLNDWHATGQAKITLKVDSEEELASLLQQAREAGLPAVGIRDAGRTQVASGTRTVGAIGPAPGKLIDCITGHLKLY